MEKLGERIKLLRELRGLSQQEIERKVGIKREYLSKLETGELKNPTYQTLKRIAEGIGISLGELVEARGGPYRRGQPAIKVVSPLRSRRLYTDIESGKYIAIPIVERRELSDISRFMDRSSVKNYALINSQFIKPSHQANLFCTIMDEQDRSMQPFVQPGALVCVDTTREPVEKFQGKMVLMVDDNRCCHIRHLKLMEEMLVGLPANRQGYSPVVLPAEAKERIVGRVIWCWSRFD